MATKTADYLAKVRNMTGFSDYKISQKYSINQSNLSKYSSGKAGFSEAHAWVVAGILGLNPAVVVANTKLEQAKINNKKDKVKFWQQQLESLKSSGGKANELKISIAQINPIVGDLEANTQKIIDLTIEACDSGANLVIFPELVLTGYPAEDLLLRKGFIEQIDIQIKQIMQKIPRNIAIIFGAPSSNDGQLYNSAYLLEDGRFRLYNKRILPNYGVFDEKRYFVAGADDFVFEYCGKRLGLLICEDIWSDKCISSVRNLGVDILIGINASPFQIDKHKTRLDTVKQRVIGTGAEFIYVNMIGGQDELVFDGGSFVVAKNGEISHQLPFFEAGLYDLRQPIMAEMENCQMIYEAMVLAVRDYVGKNGGFKGAVIGLSGGIDSALTLAIAVDALGAKAVQAVMMPYKYTSNMSVEDAKIETEILGVDYQQINIYALVSAFNDALSGVFMGAEEDKTEENLQARIRGTLLMAISNKSNKILLTTGNKSEMAVGYATLYGDMAGGFAPLKDLEKTRVFELAKYRNSLGLVIPQRVIDRPPSAELAAEQVDSDSLPPYDQLDAILGLFIEQKQSIDEIVEQGFEQDLVEKITSLVLQNEYKRRQSAPGPKISANAFGKERRYPMTSKFKP